MKSRLFMAFPCLRIYAGCEKISRRNRTEQSRMGSARLPAPQGGVSVEIGLPNLVFEADTEAPPLRGSPSCQENRSPDPLLRAPLQRAARHSAAPPKTCPAPTVAICRAARRIAGRSRPRCRWAGPLRIAGDQVIGRSVFRRAGAPRFLSRPCAPPLPQQIPRPRGRRGASFAWRLPLIRQPRQRAIGSSWAPRFQAPSPSAG